MTVFLRRSLFINVAFKYANLLLAVTSGIVLVPFYLTHLTITEYGAWLAVGSFATWFAAMDPGIANLLIQKVSHSLGAGNKQALAGYFVAGVILSTLVAAIALLSGYLFSPVFIRWLGIDSVSNELLIKAFRLAIGSTAIMIVAFSLIGVIQGLHNSLAAGLLVILGGITKIFAAIFCFINSYGLLSLPIAELCGALFMLIGSMIVLGSNYRNFARSTPAVFDRLKEFVALFAYSFGARLGKIITGSLDNVLIARLIGAEQVALYSLTATVPRQAENLVNQPISAFRPSLAYLSANAPTDGLAAHLERMLRWIIWLSGWILAGLVSLNDDFVRLWVGSSNFAGAGVALALALLFWVRVWTNSTGAIGFSLGDIKRNSMAEWAYSLLLIPSLIMGAMAWGLVGIAAAHVAVQLLTMAWYFPWSIWQRLQWRGEKTKAMLWEAILAVVAVAIANQICPPVGNWPDFVLAGMAVTTGYLLTLLAASAALRREMKSLWVGQMNKNKLTG